jgi:hypothetical protein
MCRSVANANSLHSDSGLQLIDRANDFINAGCIMPARAIRTIQNSIIDLKIGFSFSLNADYHISVPDVN